MQREPAVVISAVVASLIALYVAFGGDLNDVQKESILEFVAIVGPILAGLVIRAKVVSPDTAERIVASAHRTPPQRDLPADVYQSIPNVTAAPAPPEGIG